MEKVFPEISIEQELSETVRDFLDFAQQVPERV